MSFISTTLPQAVSPAAQPAQAQSAATNAGTAQQTIASNNLSSGQAATVALGAQGKARGVSSGKQREVDGAFEKQELKEKSESSSKGKNPTARLIDVQA